MSDAALRVVTAQKGGREHYLFPRSLYRAGVLARSIVDWHSSDEMHRALSHASLPVLQRVADAHIPELSEEYISDQKIIALIRKGIETVGHACGRRHEAFTWTDSLFARWVASLDLPDHSAFIGYSYASLEALWAEKKRGVFTVVSQIDPGRYEWRLVQREAEAWPTYARPAGEEPDRYFRRAEREWDVADLILVNSEWTRRALDEQGANPEKIEILPPAYDGPSIEPSTASETESQNDGGPLRVLWLGTAGLRKGIPYFVEAARRLRNANMRFLVAGAVGIRKKAVAAAPDNITWKGHIPRSDVPQLLRRADVHVLPTLSDGFGMTQIEALAYGTPIVATPNCGRVVEPGRTGFLVEPRSVEDIVEALLRFEDDRSLLAHMGAECVKAASRYTIDAHGEALCSLLRDRLDEFPGSSQ